MLKSRSMDRRRFIRWGKIPWASSCIRLMGICRRQLMRPDRKPFPSGDWFGGTTDEYREEATTYIAYSGPFHVDEEHKTLTHSMFVSMFPNWTGQTQPRVVKIEGQTLHLSTASPIKSSGKVVNSYLQ
jgi:hypothetical protein